MMKSPRLRSGGETAGKLDQSGPTSLLRNRLAFILAGILPILACSAETPAPANTDRGNQADIQVPDTGSLPDPDQDAGVEDDSDLTDDAGNEDVDELEPIITNADEGIDLGDFSANEGMGLTVRSLANSLRVRPTVNSFGVTFINPAPTGWTVCGTRALPGSVVDAGNPRKQQWWDDARRSFSARECPSVDVGQELPFGFPIATSDTFSAVSAVAERPYKPGAHISMREHLRRNFLLAFHETELYRFLEDRYPGLSAQFSRLVINGIAAQETSFGANLTVSRTGARGVMQTQRSAYIDARRNPAWARVFRGPRGRPMRVRFNTTLHTTPWQSARVAAIEFDNIFRHFRSTWTDRNHPVWRYPEAFLVPALIGAYNNGPTRVTNMLTRRLADEDLSTLLAGDDREVIMNQAYMLASTQYFLNRTDAAYGRESVAYVPQVYAWDALFEGGNATTSTPDAGIAAPTAPQSDAGVAVSPPMIVTTMPVIPNRSALGRWSHARLDDIRSGRFQRTEAALPLRARVVRDAEAMEFATSNISQGNVRVHAWLLANDPLARRFANGVRNDAVLQTTVQQLVADGTLVAADPHRLPLLAFDAENIAEPWRRVIRRDHVPVVERLTEEVNVILRERGMNPELYVIPMINSTVRSVAANNRLRGHSARSAHLMFTALDVSSRQFVVMRRMRDGTYQRATNSENANAEAYFQALIKASVRLARQGMLFIRYHGPPQHFHLVPRVTRASRRR